MDGEAVLGAESPAEPPERVPELLPPGMRAKPDHHAARYPTCR